MIKDGIINLNKPMGMTSHDCISRMRRLTGIKRIGHTGTLDPNATGVLPICIGSAARITEYLDLDFKTYFCTLKLGIKTDTQDIWGETISDKREELQQLYDQGKLFAQEEIEAAFAVFSGIIKQYPPKYSAIRVGGKRLYEYARADEDVEIKSRKIYIEALNINTIDLENLTITFTVTCSKGTYIRTICHDVGNMLGCGATMSGLVRLACGAFQIEDSITFEELGELDEDQLNGILLSADYPLVHFGTAILDEERARRFASGGHIKLSEVIIEREPEYKDKEAVLPIRVEYRCAYNMFERKVEGDLFIGVAFYNTQYKKLVADKVFVR